MCRIYLKHCRYFIVCLLVAVGGYGCQAQSKGPWNGKSCAVVLTYDDALVQHLDNGLPVLDSLQLKATFYLSAAFPGAAQHISEWKKVAEEGHELGNHTLFHPCLGNLPGREWVGPEQDMSRYTVKRMQDEILMTNVFLEALDGKKKRTFAYTCGDTKIGDTAFLEPLKDSFVAARGVSKQLSHLADMDLYNVNCYVVNGESADEMMEWVKQAKASHALLVILFHGVNGGNALNLSLADHSRFLHYLKSVEADTWIAPMIDVAEFVKAKRK